MSDEEDRAYRQVKEYRKKIGKKGIPKAKIHRASEWFLKGYPEYEEYDPSTGLCIRRNVKDDEGLD